MLLIEKNNSQLDDLLQRIGYKLQISKTQRELAEGRYNAVAKWLTKDDALFQENDIDVYSQGSLRIGTTVKPLKQQEYDLDIVFEINDRWHEKNPLDLLDSIEDRLRDNDVYKSMVERKNRCIRLNYANEFHMDILPAHPTDSSNSTCIKVPDRKVEDWKDSNPKGYANWFDARSHQYYTLLEKSANIDPLPEDESIERKPPLKRAVQLMKRFRDVYFEQNSEEAPISIVLTTLAGQCYRGQASVAEALSSILQDIIELIPQDGSRLVVLNPSNLHEDLSERWIENKKLYQSFVTFIKDFNAHWSHLLNLHGIHKISEELKKMFGENIITESLKEQTDFYEQLRNQKRLSVVGSTGLLTVAATSKSIPLRENTFYGD
ncbi:nucleotidyltransferase [Cohnella sp. WQ 127256]|uniref:nucleotidyltransferase domain-containing protein n=1 Tax=Cohnella sp. WQ 127256 TaxID=2938790 RepID=UPI002117C8B6|nr:nucleotidyltransferase [Cohnella sp. WQ 127256]